MSTSLMPWVLSIPIFVSVAQAQQPPTPDPAGVTSSPNTATSPQAIPPALVAAAPPPGQQQVARGPTLKAALKLAKKVEEACHTVHIAVSVVDAAGTPKLFYVPDGTAGFHAFTAFRKANTALKFNMPSSKVQEATKSDPALAAQWEAGSKSYSNYAGGLLLMVGKDVIGAVGVSGAPRLPDLPPGYTDEVCAIAGIKSVQSLLR